MNPDIRKMPRSEFESLLAGSPEKSLWSRVISQAIEEASWTKEKERKEAREFLASERFVEVCGYVYDDGESMAERLRKKVGVKTK